MSDNASSLVAAALHAAENAYAPYSSFHVGAAVLLEDGSVIVGTNFENASFGLTLCAEAVAIAAANSQGRLLDIREIAIAGGPVNAEGKITRTSGALAPCGRCRQMLHEVRSLTGKDVPVHCGHEGGHDTHMISALLPHSFSADLL